MACFSGGAHTIIGSYRFLPRDSGVDLADHCFYEIRERVSLSDGSGNYWFLLLPLLIARHPFLSYPA